MREQRSDQPVTMTEAQLTAAILDALSRSGRGMFFRNNTGKLQDARGRWVTFGLGVGSPDIVGISSDGPGGVGRFVGIEIKTETGRVSPEQAAWLGAARKAGALVGVVRSVREALALVGAP
jgi:hypothetical protein